MYYPLFTDSLVPIFWDKFKAFYQKVLGDFPAFVNNY